MNKLSNKNLQIANLSRKDRDLQVETWNRQRTKKELTNFVMNRLSALSEVTLDKEPA